MHMMMYLSVLRFHKCYIFCSRYVFQKPWTAEAQWPKDAAEMFFLIGLCHMETKYYTAAHEAFNNAIRVDSKHADVRVVSLSLF